LVDLEFADRARDRLEVVMGIYRVLVTGGRLYLGEELLCTALDYLLALKGKLIVIHGDCPTGADRFARDWSRRKEGKVFECRCPADWADPFLMATRMAKLAGHARNELMLVEFKPDLVLAFPGGTGTADCVAKAHARGVKVELVGRKEESGDGRGADA
jgi:hypothetical protein